MNKVRKEHPKLDFKEVAKFAKKSYKKKWKERLKNKMMYGKKHKNLFKTPAAKRLENTSRKEDSVVKRVVQKSVGMKKRTRY